ncbi:MAG: SGNH/GDSL hydrolase family protein [Candidatus Binatia bacterium]
MSARPIRIVAYLILILIGLVWVAARSAPPIVVAEEDRDVTIAAMEETLAELRRATAEHGPLVIVVGDSSLGWHPPLGPDEWLKRMLEREEGRVGFPVRVVQHDGYDAVAYYLLVDQLAALRPAAVVLTANLQSFTDEWFKRTRMKHPQLAAFIRPLRVPAAMQLPLELAGITDASLVVKPVFRVLGASDVPEQIDGYRTRLREGLDDWLARSSKSAMATGGVAWADPAPAPPGVSAPAPGPAIPAVGAPAVPSNVVPPPGGGAPVPAAPVAPKPMMPLPGALPGKNARRPNAPAAGAGVMAKGAFRFMDLYPENLAADQSTVRVFAATVHDLVARGVRTVVVLAPLHLQAAKATGAYVSRNLPQAEKVVRELTVDNGGHFVDLAEVLPQESYFVDRYTHFTADGNRIVLDKLLAELGTILGRSASAANP